MRDLDVMGTGDVIYTTHSPDHVRLLSQDGQYVSNAFDTRRGVFAYTQITQTVTHKFEEKKKKKYIKNNKINK